MLGERSNRLLLIGVGVSLLLHVSGAWVVYAVGNDRGGSSEFQRPEVHDPAPDPPRRIELGNPDSRAVSVTWLGYDEYKKHVAAPSKVDQPDLTMDPASAGVPGTPGSMAAATAAVAQATSAARAEAQRTFEEVAAGLRAVGSWAKVLPEGKGRVKDVVASGESEVRRTERPTKKGGVAEEKVAQQEEKKATAEQAKTAQGQEEASGTVMGSTARRAVEGERGRQDDRESDPTSINQSELGDPGQPLAARGLRIRTVRPVFSHYTSIMSKPRDPVVRIHFGASGHAKRVDLIEATGNPDIDRPVLDAVYRWTASGESLKDLVGSETVTVDVRILL